MFTRSWLGLPLFVSLIGTFGPALNQGKHLPSGGETLFLV